MQPSQPLPPKDPPSLGRLARQISRWTTNSLLTAMLLVIALGFGREVLHWWHDDAGPRLPASALSSVPPAAAGDSQVMAFGNQDFSIRRQEFSGSQADMAAALVAFCGRRIASALPRGDAADEAEKDVLRRLSGEKPVAEEPGRWRLYQWSGGCPIVVGVRVIEWHVPELAKAVQGNTTRPSLESQGRATPTTGTNLAEPACRVVVWGMAVPTAPNVWSFYVFQSDRANSDVAQAAKTAPLPPGSRRLASIRGADGSAITAFTAEADLGRSARQFYDRWFAERGWTAADPWRQVATGWHARFKGTAPNSTAISIRLGTDSQGKSTGVIMETER